MNNEQNNQNNWSNNMNNNGVENLNVPLDNLNIEPNNSSMPGINNQNNMAGNMINLNPEGKVEEVPTNIEPENKVEPLMGTTLSSTSNINLNNNVQSTSVNQIPENNMNNFNQPNQPNQMDNLNQASQINSVNQMSNFGTPNNIDMMGVMAPPPIEEPSSNNKKGKKGGNKKTLILILVIVLIFAVAGGLYYVLVISKNKVNSSINIVSKVDHLELNDEIELDKASSYVTVTGYDINSCTVKQDIDITKVGKYHYSVTCGSKTLENKEIEVKDTLAPVVEVKEVIVTPNTTITPEDFIENIEDASVCTSKFKDDVNTENIGNYTVEIEVSDAYENTTVIEANLIVSENAPASYLICESDDTESENKTSYRFGIDKDGNFFNAKKVITYTYDTNEAYQAAKKEYDDTKTLNGLNGQASFNSKNKEITFTINETQDELKEEFNLDAFPTVDSEIEATFQNGCEIENN